jgi:hypothetical protein
MILRFIYLILISVIILSCNDSKRKVLKNTDDPVENIVNYVTSIRDNFVIELPNLYDSLTNRIAEDSSERMILVEALKKRDFKIIDWGRGNYPPLGSRIVSIKMKKGNCFCQIDKIYYKTISDSLFQMTERIRCSDSLTFYIGDK